MNRFTHFGFFSLLILFFVPIISQAATLTLSPSSSTVSAGSNFTVTILLNTTSANTYGVDINRLRFNPALLRVVDADAGTSGIQIAPGSLMSITSSNTVDNVAGNVQFSQLANPGSTFNGSGTLATITFTALTSGTASVTIDYTSGSGTDSNVAGLGSDLLTSVGNGTYTINVLDTTAPSLSNGAPTGSLVYTTTSTTMSVTTNENATCRFSSNPNTAYASMTLTFSTTGGTNHSTSITGLTSGNTYTRYVRCQDSSGNANTSDYAVTFSVASPPDTTPPTISAISATGITTSSATISWTTNEVSDTQVEYGLTTAYGQITTLNTALVTSHSATLSGLSQNTTYHYRVKSKDASLNLSNSADQTFSTQAGADTTAPTVPTNVVFSGVGQTSVTISWNASTDPTGSGQSVSGVAGYQIWRDGVQLLTQAGTSYTNTGLNTSTTYSYQIAAYDNAGNVSARTTASNVTTTAPTPIQRTVTFTLEGAPVGQRIVSGTLLYMDTTNSFSYGQASVTTNSSGVVTVTLPMGLPGTINIRTTANGYLSRIITGVNAVSTSILAVTSPTLPAGDFNVDQIINSLDFSVMNTNWQTSNATADINKDGAVNSLDFAYLSNNWLQVGQ